MILKFLKSINNLKKFFVIQTKNTFNLYSYYLFKDKDIEVIKFTMSSEMLYGFIHNNSFQKISDLIKEGERRNLQELDLLLEDDDFWENKFSKNYNMLRDLLKIGWLIKDIQDNGIKNPIQLIPSGENKYLVHPGTARILILTYIIPQKNIPVYYVWDKKIDPSPPILHTDYTVIKSPREFLKMFNKSNRFRIITARLHENFNCEKNTKFSYFWSAKKAISERTPKFQTDFITTFDIGHWDSKIRKKIYFKDVISFSENQCILGGIKFIKINDLWVVDR